MQGDVVRARLEALVAELGPAPTHPAPAASPPTAEPEEALPRRALQPRAPARVVSRVWEFGRAHAAVIGVVGLVALVGAVWAISQARTVPVAVAAPTPVAPVSAASPTPGPTPTPTPEPLRVHVLGAVAHPGVVLLPPGARVEDAIEAAGGLTSDARPGELNLAAPVTDGAQVLIGDARHPAGEVRSPGGGSGAGAAAGTGGAGAEGVGRLDLNGATLEQLDALPGVGPVTARAILDWRERHQRFSRVEELLEIDGIGAKTFQRLEPHVRV